MKSGNAIIAQISCCFFEGMRFFYNFAIDMDKEFAEVYNLTYKKVGTFCLLHYNHILQPLKYRMCLSNCKPIFS